MAAKEDFKNKVEYYNDKDYFISKLEKQIETVKKECYDLANEISNLRKNKAKEISKLVVERIDKRKRLARGFKDNFKSKNDI